MVILEYRINKKEYKCTDNHIEPTTQNGYHTVL